MYDAVVFDFDGVIVEPPSNDALCAAASDALEGVNLDANPVLSPATSSGGTSTLSPSGAETGASR